MAAKHSKAENAMSSYFFPQIEGQKTDDVLVGTTGADSIRAKAGDDTINGGTGDDFITGDAGNDKITAGKGNDRVDGGAGDDIIYARDGDDIVLGGSGNDRIMGDAGNDWIWGGTGNDLLAGGADADTFFFAFGDGKDTITDFVSGTDHIDLSATGLSFGDLVITAGSAGLTITYGSDSILLKGVASVNASDFVF